MKSKFAFQFFVLLALITSMLPSEVNALGNTAAPPADMFQLPWEQGKAWVAMDGFDNGTKRATTSPHNYKMGGAVDFAPHVNMQVGEDTSSFWVTAAAGGTVFEVSSCHVKIDHGNGWTTEYWHLDNVQVKKYDVVSRNQKLGVVADNKYQHVCTGNEYPGPHLHFVMRPDMKATTFAGWTINYNSLLNKTTFSKGSQNVGSFVPLLNAPNLQIVTRDSLLFDINYTGSVDAYRFERWSLNLPEPTTFNINVSPSAIGLIPTVVLLDSNGNEISRANGILNTTQPAGNYFVQIQPEAGNGFYSLVLHKDSTSGSTNTPTLVGTVVATTDTPTQTATPVVTDTATSTPTPIFTDTPTATPTSVFADTPTFTPTLVPSSTPFFTDTPMFTNTPVNTDTPTATETPIAATATNTLIFTETATATSTVVPTNTPMVSDTPTSTSVASVTDTPIFTNTPTATNIPVTTDTPVVTSTPSITDTPVSTNTPAVTATSVPTGPYVLTDVTTTTLILGQTSVVTVSLNNIPAEGYTSAEFICSYNQSLLEVSNVALASVFGTDPVSAMSGSQNGSFILAVAGSNGQKASGSGPAFTFNVKALQLGQTPVECTARVSKGQGVLENIQSIGDNVTILASISTPTATPVTSTNISGQVIASKPVLIRLFNPDNTVAASTTTNPDGTFNITISGGVYTIVASAEGFLNAQGSVVLNNGVPATMSTVNLLAGDIDGNSIIDQFDALTLGMNYNASTPTAADLNNDGVINVLDLQLLAANYHKSGALAWQ
ncbi:MAG: peptidoglycan DD-metalloendopeptidase family protein [Anaerolineales bacterium]